MALWALARVGRDGEARSEEEITVDVALGPCNLLCWCLIKLTSLGALGSPSAPKCYAPPPCRSTKSSQIQFKSSRTGAFQLENQRREPFRCLFTSQWLLCDPGPTGAILRLIQFLPFVYLLMAFLRWQKKKKERQWPGDTPRPLRTPHGKQAINPRGIQRDSPESSEARGSNFRSNVFQDQCVNRGLRLGVAAITRIMIIKEAQQAGSPHCFHTLAPNIISDEDDNAICFISCAVS